MANLVDDLRYALRMMRKRPGVTAVAVLTLALGIGATTAMFTVVNAVLLKPLPYAASDRLVFVSIGANTGFGDRTSLPVADFLAWQSVNRACDKLAVYTSDNVVVSGLGDAEQVVGTQASAQFFAALGITPAFGRVWRDGDDRPGSTLTVVVSYTFWERRLRADTAAIGRTLILDGRPHVIIGVAPSGFAFPRRYGELWSILPLEPPARRGPFFLRGLGLMHPGASVAQVQADLRVAETAVRQTFPSRNATNYRVEPLKTVITGDARPALLLLVAAVAVVLLLSIGNVANLLLAGAAEREREIAVRAALGAGRGRITRQLVTEGLVLALAGAAAGWIGAAWATRVLVTLAPTNLPRLTEIRMDMRVLAFTVLAAVVSGVLFGGSPALHLSDRSFVETLQAGVRSSSRTAARRLRNALVVAEIALALTLAIGAALLGKSLIRLQHVEVGFSPEHIVTASMTPPAADYPGGPRVVAFFDDLLRRIETLPGVTGAAVTNSLPPDGLSETDNFVVEDRQPSSDRGAPVGPILSVSDSYFRVLGVPLIRGRWFSHVDSGSSAPVVIISAALARQYFDGVDPIGRRMKQVADWPRPDGNPWLTVVGVVGDVKYAGLAGQADPVFYLPLRQSPFRNQNLVVRSTDNPSMIVAGIREVLLTIDPNLPLAEVRTMDERLWASSGEPRFHTWLMALFGAMGLTLAAIGIYGVMAYSVAQRTREIGIRAALGATRGGLLRMVLGQSLRLATIGVVIGLALALATGRLIGALLFAVSPADTFVLAGATCVLMAVALLSALLPARRAAAVDPIVALRAD
jgi:putative ABC transport system permease protein